MDEAGDSEDADEDAEDSEGDDDEEGDEEPAAKRMKKDKSDGDEDDAEEMEDEGEDGVDLEDIAPIEIEDDRKPDKTDALLSSTLDKADGESAMQWLLSPMEMDKFLDDVFERRAALIRRTNNKHYYGDIMSTSDIERLLERGLKYGTEVDVTLYKDSKRLTINSNNAVDIKKGSDIEIDAGSEGTIADPKVVWQRFQKDLCSVRILHPQRFLDSIWRFVAALDNFWMCPVGSNAYLTPPQSQGFAPHWDDIDAFILQLEGQKRWRLYAPTSSSHILPMRSSRDFNRDELGDVILDVVLEPGDLLYLPRGMVHEAETVGEKASLHLTISANQDRSYAALLQEILPRAVAMAAQKNVALRQTVTKDFLKLFGSVLPSAADPAVNFARKMFASHATQCWHAIVQDIDLDWGADQVASEFMLQRMPPAPKIEAQEEGISSTSNLTSDSWVEIKYPGTVRVMIDDEGETPMAIVCHSLSNDRAIHASFPSEPDHEGEATETNNQKMKSLDDNSAPPPQLEFPVGCAQLLAEVFTDSQAVKIENLTTPEEGSGVSSIAVVESLVKAGLLRIASEPQ